MGNVTFIPKKLTPWELQKQFVKAASQFYSFLVIIQDMENIWSKLWDSPSGDVAYRETGNTGRAFCCNIPKRYIFV